MSKKSKGWDESFSQLIFVILDENTPYPWSPQHPEADTYFREIEKEISLTDALESEELAIGAGNFFLTMDNAFRNLRENQSN